MKKRANILIKNGLIFDGNALEPFEADIGISGDRISFLGKKNDVKADKIIDANNLMVAPGFIDTHAHSEFTLLADPRAEGKVCQGITTEINGNCGLSAAPLFGETLEQREKDLKEFDIHERWSSFRKYFEILASRGITLNFVTLAGHGNIRACTLGYRNKKPDNSELKKMEYLLRESISEGAIGLSTGLIYPPGVYSDTEELIELCKTLAGNPGTPLVPNFFGKGRFGIYTSHMRSEGDELLESIEEIIRIGEESLISVHISHIKTSGQKNWHKIDRALSMIEQAQNKGIRITGDRYPYTASSTNLDTILPSWVFEGGARRELERLRNIKLQETIKKDMLKENSEPAFWDNIRISTVYSDKNKCMEGKTIAYLAHRENSRPIDLLFRILIDEELKVGAIFSSMNEKNLERFLFLPYVMIGTDSSARCFDGITCKGKPHPRGFGSFPRFLGRYVKDKSLMSLSEGIHRITMLPAKTFSILNRGVIKKGAFADIVVFDYEKIIDRATFDNPFIKPEGINHVIINGTPVVLNGELTGIRAGRILRHGM